MVGTEISFPVQSFFHLLAVDSSHLASFWCLFCYSYVSDHLPQIEYHCGNLVWAYLFVCSFLVAQECLFCPFRFADDSCIALKAYQNNPYNTTLNSILPCVDLQAADSSLAEVRQEVHLMISEVWLILCWSIRCEPFNPW